MARRPRRVTLPNLDRKPEAFRGGTDAEGKADWEHFIQHVEPLKANPRVDAPFSEEGVAPVPRSRYSMEFLQAARRGNVAYTIDLHGLNEQEAYDVLVRALQHAWEEEARRVLVITGKGDGRGGILKQHVPRWLQASIPIVQHCTHAAPHMGGEGALVVTLARKGG